MPGSVTLSVSTPSVTKPGSASTMRRALVTISQALASSASARPISPAINAPRSRRTPPRAPSVRPASLSDACTSHRAAVSAGASPNTSPAATDTSAAASSACRSTASDAKPGMTSRSSAGTVAAVAATPHCASSTPSPPPTSASSTLSVSSWRTMRPLLAPSARRIAISRRRAVAFASRRLATLAHAIRSTNATPASIAAMNGRGPRPKTRSAGSARTIQLRLSGQVAASRAPNCATPEAACRALTPSAMRASTSSSRERRDAASSAPSCNGPHTCTPLGKTKSCGMTPMTRAGAPSIVTVRPTSDESPPNRRCHRPWPSSTTRGPPAMSSSAVNPRPSSGARPTTRRKSAVTRPPRTCSGSSSPATLPSHPWNAVTALNSADGAARSRKAPFDISSLDAGARSGASATTTRREGSRSCGSGRKVNTLAVLYVVVTAPMPSPSVSTATTVTPGLLASMRTA